ncbi:ion channel [Polynucleobacter kasalickyi]|uniref:Inward rectifier potassium channel n=1 Tax=Polynucleobacter kasalickyi TaxID=1938817 RepID=A0A1W1ZPZ4_9BURK|nr:ion channel [Polynucleobacter kasalickyi]SMC50615.1 inward rectifier potassium channel [Polynucleobacter kasalickyi]
MPGKRFFAKEHLEIDLEKYHSELTRPSIPKFEGNLYHWLLSTNWQSFFVSVVLVYLLSNLLFAAAYFFCGPGSVTNARPNSLVDLFFFSVQTMATIGYGQMIPVGFVPNTIVSFEAFFGIVFSALTTGLAFARFTRPTAGVRFSKTALIGLHDGTKVLRFRLGNLRSSNIVEAQLSLWLVLDRMNQEKDFYREIVQLPLDRNETPLFSFSWTAFHQLNEKSPLLGILDNPNQKNWHLLVTFTGYHESFANQVYARHVYLPSQIHHNANFMDLIKTTSDGSKRISMENFEKIKKL